MDKWIAVFKSGTHVDSAGNERSYSNDDLDTIVSQYNEQDEGEQHEAPVVIGHPTMNAPAWGWVAQLRRKGNLLQAQLKDVVTEFADLVKNKQFKKISISLYNDLTLRHVGFLGAMPPAIKGLPEFEFAEGDEPMEYEFAEVDWRIKDIGSMFRSIREWFIEKHDKETADELLPDYFIRNLENHDSTATDPQVDVGKVESVEAYNESEESEMAEEKTLQQQIDELKQENADYAEKLTRAEKERDAEKAKTAQAEADRRHASFVEFAEGLSESGELKPKHQAMAVAIMDALAGGDEIEYAEGDGTKKVEPVVAFQEFLKEVLNAEDFSETATKDKAKKDEPAGENPAASFAEKVKEIQDKEECTYIEAFHKAQVQYPELAADYAENPS